jgi:hypothetical protein
MWLIVLLVSVALCTHVLHNDNDGQRIVLVSCLRDHVTGFAAVAVGSVISRNASCPHTLARLYADDYTLLSSEQVNYGDSRVGVYALRRLPQPPSLHGHYGEAMITACFNAAEQISISGSVARHGTSAHWSQSAGRPVEIIDGDTVVMRFHAPAPGAYTFELTVSAADGTPDEHANAGVFVHRDYCADQ